MDNLPIKFLAVHSRHAANDNHERLARLLGDSLGLLIVGEPAKFARSRRGNAQRPSTLGKNGLPRVARNRELDSRKYNEDDKNQLQTTITPATEHINPPEQDKTAALS